MTDPKWRELRQRVRADFSHSVAERDTAPNAVERDIWHGFVLAHQWTLTEMTAIARRHARTAKRRTR